MTMVRTVGGNCPDINTCPAKIEDTEDASCAYVVGTCVTNPRVLDRLAGQLGDGRVVVRTPRSLWAYTPEPVWWDDRDDPDGAYVIGGSVTEPALRGQLTGYIGPGEDVVRVDRDQWGR